MALRVGKLNRSGKTKLRSIPEDRANGDVDRAAVRSGWYDSDDLSITPALHGCGGSEEIYSAACLRWAEPCSGNGYGRACWSYVWRNSRDGQTFNRERNAVAGYSPLDDARRSSARIAGYDCGKA